MDHQPRSGVRAEKSARDRLIGYPLAGVAASHPEWVLGFEDEVWWSRFERSSMHSWAPDDKPLRLVEQPVAKDDPDPKALACYRLSVHLRTDMDGSIQERMWLRFVEGRPVSAITTQFLAWCCDKLQALGKEALLLVWDNASWHKSKIVARWIKEHNRAVKERGEGVRILPCPLPSKSPWLNPIEPKWVHGKRDVAEPDGLLTADELAQRVCGYYGCDHQPHLSIPHKAA